MSKYLQSVPNFVLVNKSNLFLSGLLAISFIFVDRVHAQDYYPGGIGNSNLQLWLDANDLNTITKNGANQVSVWADKSAAASPLTLVQAKPANEPVYAAAGLNGRRSLTFSHSGPDFLALQSTAAADTTYFQGYSSFSHFCVYNSSDNASQSPTGKTTIYGRELVWKTQISSGGTGALNLYASGDGSGWEDYLQSSVAIAEHSNVLLSAIYNSANTYSAFNAGSSLGSAALGGQVLGNNANDFCVGGRPGGVEPFTGNLGEILLYNTSLSNTERVIVENYLSAKWGVTLGGNAYYATPTASTYGTNLVGIGYTSGTDNFLTDVSGSTDGLGFSSSSGASGFLNTAGYLMAAHNGQANTDIINASIPGVISANGITLWNRSWQVQRNGGNSSGQVTFNFNFSDYNGSTPSGTAVYALLYNATDGTFASGSNQLVPAVNTTVSGNIVGFSVNIDNVSNGYYSIVYSSSPIALPIVIASFQAIPEEGKSFLQWTVGTGSTPWRFDVERSMDAVQFGSIGSVSGGAETANQGQYSFIDQSPLAGTNYYRLRMTSIEGNVIYSGIRSVDFSGRTNTNLLLYPNPVADELTVSMQGITGMVGLLIINAAGSVVYTRQVSSTGMLQIPITGLAKGVYFVEVRRGTDNYSQPFFKN